MNDPSQEPAAGKSSAAEQRFVATVALRKSGTRSEIDVPRFAAWNSQALAACWSDMQQRWSQGARATVEDYLSASESPHGEEAVVDLVYAEYVLREEAGELPREEEYAQRFPQFAAAIRRQLALHRGLAGTPADTMLSPRPLQPPAEARSSTPKQIGRYSIVAKLGSGGQSDVYRAVNPALAREVVLKVARRDIAVDPAERARLSEEARLLAELDHPGLARVYDLDFWGERPYIVMELIHGQTLRERVKQRRPGPREAARLVARLAEAVDAVHRRGIVHRDIKPNNVVIDERGEPRLIDFGLAQRRTAWSSDDLEPGLFGTLPFMAPEQALGRPELVDARSDVFSLGALLFYALTGSAPFVGDTFAETLDRVRRGDWERRLLTESKAPRELQAVCVRALAKNPAERLGDAGQLAAELNRIAGRGAMNRRFAMGAGLVAVVVVAAVWRYWPQGAATAAPLSLDVRVWEAERYLALADVAPLRTGDQLQIQAEVPSGAHASLFIVSGDGIPRLLHVYPASADRRSIRYPPNDGQSVPLTGRPGTEFIVLCAASESAVELAEFQAAWKVLQPWPELPGMSVLKLDRLGVRVEQRDRGLGEPNDRPDPEAVVQRRMRDLQAALVGRCEDVAGVAFAHR